MARYPKPDSERRNRTKPVFEWTDLPAEGRKGPAPKLPPWRQWSPKTRSWWKTLWAKPQAVAWEPDGSTLWTLAALYDDLITGRAEASKVSAEVRNHEDRHGLNPKAMLQLRWRLVADEVAEQRVEPPKRPSLRAIDPDALARG